MTSAELLSSSLTLSISSASLAILISSIVFIFFLFFTTTSKSSSSSYSSSFSPPRAYPIIGSYFSSRANQYRIIQWSSDLVLSSPTATFVLHRSPGRRQIFTGNPANVQHILKTRFSVYQKGRSTISVARDFLGDGIFNVNGESWKFQRQVASHEFNNRSLKKFIETVVDTELNDRLFPILTSAAERGSVIDFQDVLQRFAFDNICNIAFGYDPAYLSPSLPRAAFADAFDYSVMLTAWRFRSFTPYMWKLKRFLDIGSEKRLRMAVSEVRELAKNIVKEKKRELSQNKQSSTSEASDLLSRFLSSGLSDEDFVVDVVISFILAGRDTTSAALTWYFWLLHKNAEVEARVRSEIIGGKSGADGQAASSGYEEAKHMTYTHASLCESMRLYPPVPTGSKEAVSDDVLPDGTVAKKGMVVTYHPYAMGRMEEIWGRDWPEFKPERWLKRGSGDDWEFVGKDAYTYPVFQAGPRVCLGKEMAFLQMKRVVAGVLRRFKVVPALAEGVEPVYVSYLTAKMDGGFPVRIEVRQ